MRIRKRKTITLQNIALVFMIIIPFTYLGVFGVEIGHGWERMVQFQYEGDYDPDTEFLTANYTRLEQMVYVYDDLFQRNHIPLNYSCFTVYNDTSYSVVKRYDFSDNGALWSGEAIAGWTYRYLTAKNEGNQTDVDYCIGVLRRLIHGSSMLMAVPNGGLGPEYPGILARAWAGPEDKDIAPFLFNEDIRHYNGTGIYSQYRWRGYTSNDEFGGYYLGLALALKYIDDGYIQNLLSLIIDQLANYMLEQNWLGINGPGGPTGVNQKPTFGGGGFWVSTLLKMASIVNPEKYEKIYYHWVASELLYLSVHEGNDGETTANYYAFNFGHCVILAFLELEDRDSSIWKAYYNGYYNSMRQYTYNHRNAWFNAIYLLVSQDKSAESEIVERDIEDQLMRMDINHFPDRQYGVLEVPEDEEIVFQINDYYQEILNDTWSGLYQLPYIEMHWDRTYYKRALTCEYHGTSYFMWQDNPFRYNGEGVNVLKEGPGTSFSVPYWMLRYMNSTGLRVINDE